MRKRLHLGAVLLLCAVAGCASAEDLAKTHAKYDWFVIECILRQERINPTATATFNRNYCEGEYAFARAYEIHRQEIGPIGRWTEDIEIGGFAFVFIAK